jgi:hypothetical protein
VGKMSVKDHGLNAIRKAAEQETVGNENEYILKTKIKNTESEAIPIQGSFTDSAITTEMKTSTIEVNDVAQAIPETNLSNRNTISIQNFSTTSTIYVGTSSGVTAGRNAGSTTDGTEIGPLETWNYAINDTATIYAICNSSETAIIKVTETA